jgi:hypothetical protein
MERFYPCPGRRVTLTPAATRDGAEWHVQVLVEYRSSEELRLQRLFFGSRRFLWEHDNALWEVTLQAYHRSGRNTVYTGHGAPFEPGTI